MSRAPWAVLSKWDKHADSVDCYKLTICRMNHRVEWHANFAANISTMAVEAIPVMTVPEHNRLQSGDLCNLCIFPYVWKSYPGNDRNSSPRSPKTVKAPFGEVTMRRCLSYALRHTDGIISAYVAAPIWYGYRISNCIFTETSRTPPVYCPVCFVGVYPWIGNFCALYSWPGGKLHSLYKNLSLYSFIGDYMTQHISLSQFRVHAA